MRKTAFLIAVSLFAFSAAGLADVMVPEGEPVQEQDYSNMNPAKVYVGQELVFNLKSNKTTGYEWQLADEIDKRMLEFVKTDYITDKSDGMVGKGGVEKWTFKAVGKGHTAIYFKYVRPWETEEGPKRTVSFPVVVEQSTATEEVVSLKPIEQDFVKGTVKSIDLASIFRRPNPLLVIIDDKGNELKFDVKPSVVVYSDKEMYISLQAVKPGDEVNVNYRYSSGGQKEAVAIKILL